MSEVKLITCCYCGAREAMRVAKGQRRTLACGACGAPMRKVEMMRRPDRAHPAPAPVAKTPKRLDKRHEEPPWRRKKGKRRKSLIARLWDEAEDLFDDLEDIFD